MSMEFAQWMPEMQVFLWYDPGTCDCLMWFRPETRTSGKVVLESDESPFERWTIAEADTTATAAGVPRTQEGRC